MFEQKVVGLCVARDESLTVGMTIETIAPLITELVFVNNSSVDGTEFVVMESCAKNNIILHKYDAGLDVSLASLRGMALQHGRELDADWFITCDADMIFLDALSLRETVRHAEYDQYWFETMNLTGGKNDISYGSINPPHLWLFRNKDTIYPFSNYVCDENTHTKCPDTPFLGWNLNGFKHYEHMFWRQQMALSAGAGLSVNAEEYITSYFGEAGPSDDYKKQFALNRLRRMCQFGLESCANYKGIRWPEFEKKYLQFPDILRDWDCPFELIYDKAGEVIGRTPDLVGVPILKDAEIEQLADIDREKYPLPPGRRGYP